MRVLSHICHCPQEGDKVLLPEFGGSSFKFNGKDLTLYSHEEILGKFE